MTSSNKTISCGILIINEFDEILLGKVTLTKDRYDIPKGHVDEGESFEDCALRECLEETGFNLDKSRLEVKGLVPYLKSKDLYLFKYRLKKEELDLSKFNCSTFFDYTPKGSSIIKKFPEINGIAWVPLTSLDKFVSKNLLKVLNTLLK